MAHTGFYGMYALLLFRFCFGAIQPVCQQTHKKEALSGDDVLLSCHTEPRINLSMSTLDWKRPNLGPHPRHIVYVYRNQKDDPQSDQDTKRMSMNHKGLQWGNLSLLISQVRPSDSGPYESYIPGRGCVCAFQLNVVNRTREVFSTVSPSTRDSDPRRTVAANFPVVALAFTITVVLILAGLACRGKLCRKKSLNQP